MSTRPSVIRPCCAEDAGPVCEIYNHYVRNSVVTFEEEPVVIEEMTNRILDVTRNLPWLVYEDGGSITGYAYATQWKTRSAYRFSVESTVYVSPDFIGQGIGAALYRALIDDLGTRGVHCAVGGIALPNPASIALHERLGFTKIGQFSKIGWKLGRWIDVGYWQLIL